MPSFFARSSRFVADALEKVVLEFLIEPGVALARFLGAGVGERPFADHAEVAVHQQEPEVMGETSVGLDVERIAALAHAEELEFLFEVCVRGLFIAGVEKPPVAGIGAERLGVVGEFFLLIVLGVHGDADDVEIRVPAEFIVDLAEFLAVAHGAVRADGEEFGGDPDFAAQVGEFHLRALLIDGSEIPGDFKPLADGLPAGVDDRGHVRFGQA
ncbi:MAG: hypothetical protein MUC40_03790 [Akkermansiaceae bacterium]|nr:hypothetical protein [Akkermansiaceae bacterium]